MPLDNSSTSNNNNNNNSSNNGVSGGKSSSTGILTSMTQSSSSGGGSCGGSGSVGGGPGSGTTAPAKIPKRASRLSSLVEDICITDDAPYRVRLHTLFAQIEKEFEILYLENLNLQEKLDTLSGGGSGGAIGISGNFGGTSGNNCGVTSSTGATGIGFCGFSNTVVGGSNGGRDSYIGERFNPTDYFESDIASNKSLKTKLGSSLSTGGGGSGVHTGSTAAASGSGGGGGGGGGGSGSASFSGSSAVGVNKLKASHKLRAQTSRIVSSFKAQSVVSSIVRDFGGHKDGVWQVTTKSTQPIVGTASADHTAAIWGIDSGRCLLQYYGHNGSVNSIKFHATKDLVLTASGDGTAQIWQGAVKWEQPSRKGHSSEEELDDDEDPIDDRDRIDVLRTPLCEFSGVGGHSSVVVAADWLPGGDQIITASWDRTAILWDIEKNEPLQPLTGHDHELTHASAHPTQRLVVTASRDSTFRLWDFRDQIPAVSVFQGHTESVTSTVFTRDDKVVSGSDDRTVKIWELRNMRSALTTIRTDSSVNRLAVSQTGVIAIPHDNRHIRLFDLNGQRVARLPRTSRLGHRRMVSSVAWTDDLSASPCNLFSCGFDRRVLGWSVCLPKDN